MALDFMWLKKYISMIGKIHSMMYPRIKEINNLTLSTTTWRCVMDYVV